MGEDYAENNHDSSDPKRKWRKKRKNFLSNAKKYAKKGQMGRGTKMSEELYQYFVGILDAIKKGIEDEEERLTNVLDRTRGDEVNIVSNQLGSRVIELLLPYASAEDLERFTEAIDPHLRKMASDNFTSHVIETLLRVSCDRATEHLQESTEEEVPKKKIKLESKKYSDEHIKKCYDYTIKMCKYVLNNLEDFVWDSYANHILRSALKCLSGIPPHTTKMNYRVVPEEFKELAKEFADRISAWPQFKDLPYKNITSALLQVLLYAVKNVDKHVTKSFAPEGWVSTGADEKKDKVDLDAMEEDSKQDIYARCFINRLARLATVPMLNFTVQRLFDNCTVKEELPAVLASGNSGVLVAVAKASLRLNAKQAHFLTCSEPDKQKYFSVACLRLTPLDQLDTSTLGTEYFIHVHGSLEGDQLLVMLCDAKGSHVADALCAGQHVGVKARDKLIWRMKVSDAVNSLLELEGDQLLVMLCDAKGSHVADALCAGQHVGVKAPDKLIWRMKVSDAVNSLLELEGDQLLVMLCDAKGSHVADALCAGQHVGVKARDKLIWRMKVSDAVNSLLELKADQLLVMLCDAKGSHVADALCAGKHVGVKARDKLIWRMKMALSQYGSRAFEKIFNSASPEQRVKIMSELADKSSLLNGTQYGKLIANKLDVAGFKVSQKKWEETWKSNQNRTEVK
ncbi:Nucleolar protein 9 [Operophtera brumata]|uniref:Nucleolar protein 9 n=1 Tax=Operophtera brumata TaxID=104452 RepID=A0A0L7KRR8_OPEBR|nr:Nucleolar protein 9 [Operophtera brumata]